MIHYSKDNFWSSTSASSITTRIKTESFESGMTAEISVRVHHPLQQGLRHWLSTTVALCTAESTSASSITTRIKTCHTLQK